ncbi:MAG: mannitol dehydrogenase family protein [Oceanicaulis sp.]
MSARLTPESLITLPAHIARPAYDRARIQTGIVHIGPGAFHRAHQAQLIDDVVESDPRWGIDVIALRSRETLDALRAQGGLFTLKRLQAETQTRVIGSIRRAFGSQLDPEGTMMALAGPQTRLITLTITEKGYCLAPDGALDLSHHDIIHDLAHPAAPRSAPGWLAAALARRKASGAGAPVILSCDNLEDNGRKLAQAVITLARQTDPGLAGWIETRVLFPRSMVDSITPASDAAFLDQIEGELGVRDEAAVQREGFSSWVIEAADAEPLHVLGQAGVVLTQDVEGHCLVKLRVLNGAHSALAWTGLAMGETSVAGAMGDDWLRGETEALIRDEILPGLAAPDGLDLEAYASSVLARFANPAIVHLLSQIAWDSSQKLPVRLLGTVEANLAAGRPVDRLSRAIAAWMRLIVRAARNKAALTDPLADQLTATGLTCTDDPDADTARFLTLQAVFSARLAQHPGFRAALSRGYRDIIALERGARPVLELNGA